MTQQSIEHPLRMIVDALGAIVPVFALFRCSAEFATNRQPDTVSADLPAECVAACGICPSDALEMFCANDKDASRAKNIRVSHGNYHLICFYEKDGSGAFQDEGILVAILRKQLAIYVHILDRHRAVQPGHQLDLITHALDAIPQSVFVLDREQRYVFQNLSDRRNFGDLRGKRIEDSGIDADMAATWKNVHDKVLSGESFDHKKEKQANGRSFTTRTIISPVHDENGISGIVGLSLDCSEEAAASARLQENESRLRSWLRLSSDWVWELDAAYRFTQVQGDAHKHGFDFSKWLGRTRWEIAGADPADSPEWADYKDLLGTRKAIRGLRMRIMRQDGTSIIVEVNADPIFDAAGTFTGYRGVTRDVTDREELLSRLQRAEMIANETQHAIVITDAKGRITWVNPAFSQTTGYALEEVIGYTPGSILQCPETSAETVAEIRAAIRHGKGIRTTILNRAKNGRHYWLDLEIRPIYCQTGKLEGFIALENDITDLINDKTRRDAIFENATAGIVIHDETGATIDHNFEAARILGVRSEQLLGRTAMDPDWHLVDEHGIPLSADKVPAMRALKRKETVRNQIVGVRNGSGQTRWLRANAQVFAASTEKSQVLVSFSDVTEEENARRDVETARELMSTIIETMPDGVAAFDQDDRLLLCNSAYKQIYPKTAPAMHIGASFESILRYSLQQGEILDAGQSHSEREAWLRDRMQQHRHPKAEPSLQRLSDGRWLQVRERVSPSGVIVGVRSDITALKRAEQKVRLAAEQDALTGLANRTAFIRSFEQSLNGSRANDGAGLVALIDLDHFKDLNDTLGHDIGDAYLREISKRLKDATRAGDVVARLGGDEFAILMPGITNRSCAMNAIETLVGAVTQSVWLGGKIIHPQMSIGVSVYPEDGTRVSELMKNADIAMYATKKSGRNGITLFDPIQKQYLARRTFVSERLREALRSEMLDVAFQAQVDLQTGQHLGFEALARWKFSGEQISPAEFIPISEEFGLSQEIDMQVLNKSLLRLRHLKDLGHMPGKVAINIGTALLRDESFPLRVANLLGDSGLSPRDIEIEVTEGVMIERGHERIRSNLAALRDLGVSIALDDFGTGYASLSHLKDFRVDKLKIDQSFIRDIATDRSDETIVKTIINLARSLEIKVVAEGIETNLQKQFLSNHGCHTGQGYLFHQPEIDTSAIEDYLKKSSQKRINQPQFYRGARVA